MANTMPYPARADMSEFTPEPHFMPAEPDTNPGRTMSAARNRGQRGMEMRADKNTLEKFPKLDKIKGSA